jgi:hypothetical protein
MAFEEALFEFQKMARSKKAQAELRAQKLRQATNALQQSSDSEDSTVAPKVFERAKKKANNGRGRPKKSVIEEVDVVSDEDELARNWRGVQKPVSTNHSARREKILKALEKAASLLAPIGDAEDIWTWIQENGLEDNITIKELEQYCSTISRFLREKSAPPKTSSSKKTQGTVQPLGPQYVFRDSAKSVMLLGPVETIKVNVSLAKKTIGFVRKKGTYYPVMCAISGFTECVEDHPYCLDNEVWTQNVYEFGKWHQHKFRSDGFDSYHGKPVGYGFAGHVEPKLMLFWALRLLGKFTRTEVPSIGRLWELKEMRGCKEGEILLSQEPCDVCLRFQTMLERMCGIRFTLIIVPNLGELKPVKDKYGYKKYPSSAQAIQFGGTEDQLQVIVPLKHRNDTSLGARLTKQDTTSSKSGTKDTRRSKVTETTFIEIQNVSRKRAYDSDSEDNSDGYTPSPQEVARSLQTPTPEKKRKSQRGGILTPDYTPRKFEALDLHLEEERSRAERQHKKRPSFPSVAKKFKHA